MNKKQENHRISMNMKLALILSLLFILPMVSFGQTQQFAKFPLSPAYAENILDNKPVSFTLAMDNINFSKIVSVEIHFIATQKTDTDYFLTIDGKDCDVPKFLSEGSGQREVIIDCTSQISAIGKYALELTQINTLAAPLSSIYGWAEVTYFPPEPIVIQPIQKGDVVDAINQYYAPHSQLLLHGTDYFKGERATVFLQLTDTDSRPINNASCQISIYNTTNVQGPAIFSGTPMVGAQNGVYYYQFSTQSLTEGVYPSTASCDYIFRYTYRYPPFSVSTPVITVNLGSFLAGTNYALNDPSDFQYIAYTQSLSTINITLGYENISSNSTAIDFYWLGETNNAPTFTFYVFNVTGNKWLSLGTLTMSSGGQGSSGVPTGQDDLFTASVPRNLSNFINSTGGINFQFVENGLATTLRVGWATVKFYSNSSEAYEVKGSSEVHIYPDYLVSMWNTTNSTAFTNKQLLFNITTNLTSVQNTAERTNTTVLTNNQLLFNITTNLTSIQNTVEQINTTTVSIQSIVTSIQNTVNSIFTYVQLIYNQTTEINATTHALSTPNVTVNVTFNSSVNLTVNVTQQTVSVNNISVIENITNITFVDNNTFTTVIVNTTNTTVNVTQQIVSVSNITVVENITNTTVNTNTVVVNTTNTTINVTQQIVSVNNISVVENITNITFVDNNTFTTVIVNTTNTIVNVTQQIVSVNNISVVVNTTNTTFSPTLVSNVTFVDNSTTNVTVIINDTGFSNNLTQIYGQLFVINNTVNRIELNTLTINATVNSIQSTVNSILTFVTNIYTQVQLIYNQTTQINATLNALNTTPNVVVNLTVNTTTQIVSVSNTTVNVTNAVVFNTTVNVTNANVQNITVVVNTTQTDISNVTSILNEINGTVGTINSTVSNINNSLVPNTIFIY